MPRASTLVIVGQSVLLLVCCVYLAKLLIRNYCLAYEAKSYANSAGCAEARRNFLRGHSWLYEIKPFKFDADDSGPVPTDGDIKPADKMDGRFKVYYYLVNQSFPSGYWEVQQSYVDGYNRQMRLFFDHPEWFDQHGLRIPLHELKSQTNRLDATAR